MLRQRLRLLQVARGDAAGVDFYEKQYENAHEFEPQFNASNCNTMTFDESLMALAIKILLKISRSHKIRSIYLGTR